MLKLIDRFIVPNASDPYRRATDKEKIRVRVLIKDKGWTWKRAWRFYLMTEARALKRYLDFEAKIYAEERKRGGRVMSDAVSSMRTVLAIQETLDCTFLHALRIANESPERQEDPCRIYTFPVKYEAECAAEYVYCTDVYSKVAA